MKYSEAISEATKKALEGTDFQLGSKWSGTIYSNSIYVDGEKQTLANVEMFKNLVAKINSIDFGAFDQASATFIMRAYISDHVQRETLKASMRGKDCEVEVVSLPEGAWGFEPAKYIVVKIEGMPERTLIGENADKVLSQFKAEAGIN